MQKSIKWKVLISVFTVIVVIFTVLLGFITYNTRKMTVQQAEENALAQSKYYAKEVEKTIDRVSQNVNGLSSAIEGAIEIEPISPQALNTMLKNIINDNDQIIASWAIILDGNFNKQEQVPSNNNVISEIGDFIPYWARNESGLSLTPLNDYDKPGSGDWNLISREKQIETIMNRFIMKSMERMS